MQLETALLGTDGPNKPHLILTARNAEEGRSSAHGSAAPTPRCPHKLHTPCVTTDASVDGAYAQDETRVRQMPHASPAHHRQVRVDIIQSSFDHHVRRAIPKPALHATDQYRAPAKPSGRPLGTRVVRWQSSALGARHISEAPSLMYARLYRARGPAMPCF